MSIVTRVVDRTIHDFNTVASAGTSQFSFDLSTYSNFATSAFEVKAVVLGTAINGNARDSYKTIANCSVSFDLSGNTLITFADSTNIVSDSTFNSSGGSPSTATWAIVSQSTSIALTVTNNGTVTNDFTAYVEIEQVSNSIVSPLQIPNLKLWLRSDLGITLNGSTVSAWADQSGNSNNVSQGTTSQQPTFVASDSNFNNQASLTFSHASNTSLVGTTLTLPQPLTIYACGLMTLLQNAVGLIDANTAGEVFLGNGGTTQWELYSGAPIVGGTANTSKHAFCGAYTGTISAMYVDDSQNAVASGNALTQGFVAANGVAIGGSATFTTTFSGSMTEIFIYSGTHTSKQRQAIFKYLGARYNITVS